MGTAVKKIIVLRHGKRSTKLGKVDEPQAVEGLKSEVEYVEKACKHAG